MAETASLLTLDSRNGCHLPWGYSKEEDLVVAAGSTCA